MSPVPIMAAVDLFSGVDLSSGVDLPSGVDLFSGVGLLSGVDLPSGVGLFSGPAPPAGGTGAAAVFGGSPPTGLLGEVIAQPASAFLVNVMELAS